MPPRKKSIFTVRHATKKPHLAPHPPLGGRPPGHRLRVRPEQLAHDALVRRLAVAGGSADVVQGHVVLEGILNLEIRISNYYNESNICEVSVCSDVDCDFTRKWRILTAFGAFFCLTQCDLKSSKMQ